MVKETTKRLNAIPLPDETQLQTLLDGVNQDLLDLGDLDALESEFGLLTAQQADFQIRLLDLKVELSKQEDARVMDEERQKWAKVLSTKFKMELDTDQVKLALRSLRKTVTSAQEGLSVLCKKAALEAKLASEGDIPTNSEDNIESKLGSLSKKLSALERTLPGVERRELLSQQLESLPEDDADLEVLDSRTSKWKGKLDELQSRLSVVKSEVSKLAGVGDVCYTCLRPVDTHDKEEMLRERKEELAKLQELSSKAQEALSTYSDRLSSLQKRTVILSQIESLPSGSSKEVQELITSLQKEQATIQRLSSKIARVQSIREQLSELSEVTESKEELEDIITSQESKVDLLDDAYQWLLRNGQLQFDPHALQRAYGTVNSYTAQLADVNQHLLSSQEKRTTQLSLKKQKEDLTKTLNVSSIDKQRSRVLRYLSVTIEELKKMSLRESTQLLSTVLPVYLNQLFPGGSINLSVTDDVDGFDLMFNKGGQSIPLTLVSGGQAKRVGIAIVFSFAKMGRNTTNLLICDEPFRDLDQKGREACFELLRDFDMGTILVTSHDQDMNAPKKYDRIWTVRMLNHVSRLYLDG